VARGAWRLVREKMPFAQAGWGPKGRQEYCFNSRNNQPLRSAALRRLRACGGGSAAGRLRFPWAVARTGSCEQ